jgi:phenylpropionate dioxygenase-like ring-hydroxylating dioxygenase large terminal subunit
MLLTGENRTLTMVGPGTPMGTLFRRYWHPVLCSSELAAVDGDPVRVRLLCEDLIAFRDSNGRVGLVSEHCPHRGTSLFFARNEDCGIRCIYHGWKFDVDGNCVDMPNVSAENDFKHKVRLRAYPCRELNGMIWAYLGDGDAPPFLEVEWATVPDSHRFVTKRVHECNWAQALEGDIDSSHVGFLHSNLDRKVPSFARGQVAGGVYEKIGYNRAPRIEAMETDFGLWVAAGRASAEDRLYWRVTALVLPYYTIIPPSGDSPLHVNMWQPMDDETTLVWSIQYHGARALPEAERAKLGSGDYEHYGPDDRAPPTSEAAGTWRSKANYDNDFLIDREAQRTQTFTGLHGFWRQDRAVVESMGRIYDRTQEHLGASDLGIIRFRRLFIAAANAQEKSPPGLDPTTQRIRAVAMLLPENASWRDAIKDLAVIQPDRWLPSP